MLIIRLSRRGMTGKPQYRIVVLDSKKKRDGKALEILGFWNPSKNTLECDRKKIDSWISKGAKLSTKVTSLLSL